MEVNLNHLLSVIQNPLEKSITTTEEIGDHVKKLIEICVPEDEEEENIFNKLEHFHENLISYLLCINKYLENTIINKASKEEENTNMD